MTKAFTPSAPTVTLSVTTTSSGASGISSELPTLELNNAGASTAFVRWGVGAQTATTADYPILPGHCKLVNTGVATHVAAITATGTTTLYCTPGVGDV